jgi:hypothetical protein
MAAAGGGRRAGGPDVSTAVADLRDPEPRIRDGLRDCLAAFITARVLLFVVSAIGVGALPLPAGQPTGVPGWPATVPESGWGAEGWTVLFTATERQDALWYLRIAADGYAADDVSAAFFPLYPMAIRVVSWLPLVGPLGAALLVANAAFLAALLMLHALTRFELGARTARLTVTFAALFPTAFFFLAPYTESLFLLLSVSAFWFARRERWAWAAAAGAGAALTRSVGLLLIVGLAAEAIRQWREEGRDPLPRLAGAGAAALGPLLYIVYWRSRFADAFAPVDVQASWGRQTTWPHETLWQASLYAWRYRTWWLIDLLVVALAVAAIVWAARKIAYGYTVYAAGSVLLPLLLPFADRPLLSMPRFVIVAFPLSWGLALVADRARAAETALLAACAALYGILALLFVNWHFIF